MAQKIYFDESGFTGNNLLHPKQGLFAYASVATDDEAAKDFVESLIRRYRIQNGELKGKGLVKFHKGRKAIDEIFSEFGGQLKISISNKKYALACKLFEYIFEPCISSINSIFYAIEFHKFISNILYSEFVARGAGAEEIFMEFESLMRSQDKNRLDSIFSTSIHSENSPILTQIREFAQWRANDIRDEMESLAGSATGKWVLDLTNTALFTLLAHWGTEHDVVTAVCDSSKPIEEQQESGLFTAMIGNEKRLFNEFFGEKHPITFNLSGPIEFCDSKVTHGIQIADAIAAAAVHTFSGADDDHARKWRHLLPDISRYGSVVPEIDSVNLRDLKVQRNAILLMELHSRAKDGVDLTENLVEHINLISYQLNHKSLEFGGR